MNRTSTLLCSAALALVSAGAIHLLAEPPAAPATPAPASPPPATPEQKAILLLSPERRAEADAAIQKEVMGVLQVPRPSSYALYSRAAVPRSSSAYTLAYTDTAPAGVKMDPGHVPFVVNQRSVKGESSEFVAGYYDATSQSVQLYSAAGKTYVAAAEHPFIKPRLPKK